MLNREELAKMYRKKAYVVGMLDELYGDECDEWSLEYLIVQKTPDEPAKLEMVRYRKRETREVGYINVTGDSNSAIVMEIGKELFGEGARGHVNKDFVGQLESRYERGEFHEV